LRKVGQTCIRHELAGFEYTIHFDYSKTGPVVAVRALNIRDGRLDLADVHTIPKSTSEKLPRPKLSKGDLVMSYVGTLGRVAVIPEDDRFHLAPNVAKISVNKAQFISEFLCQYLNSFGGQKTILDAAASTTQAALSMGNLRLVSVPTPPIYEQRAIAEALNDVDALIGALDQLIAKKRDLKQAAMQQLLTGQKRLPGFGVQVTGENRTALGGFPGDWALVPLSRVSAFITKGSRPTTYGFEWKSSGILFLRSECVSECGLDLSESMFIAPQAHQFLRRSEVKGGDILMTITGNVGRVVHLRHNFQSANINQHLARVRIIDENIFPSYVFHFLSQPAVRKYYNVITTGQAYPQISLAQVRDTVLPMPSLREQTAIAEVLSDMDSEIAALERRRDKTGAPRRG